MDKLDTALDDIEGLLETYRAMSDDDRNEVLRRNPDDVKELRREIASATDTYAATLMASGGGDVNPKRIRKCRKAAEALMKGAVARQKELAALVNERRLPAPALRQDVERLLTLSLECRAAVAALGPTVEKRAANALANKVLVELRAATLSYLASARDNGDGEVGKPRASVVALLEKTEGHAAELGRLSPVTPEQSESLGVGLSKHVVELLHKTALEWKTGAEEASE